LQIRSRRNGDRINPDGMQGTKKLKDFFIDEKIPRNKRDLIPVVAYENEVIWIVGKRVSEKYKITDDTKEVVVLEYMSNK
jgi:tRNA(Ile)-lysidine synthase